jgi:predicted nucleic acid-binding protein
MTEPVALIDTNILVYAFDSANKHKHTVAQKIVADAFRGSARYAVSVQNLAEFSVVVREKVEQPLPVEDVCTFLGLVARSRNWLVLEYHAKTLQRAHEIRDEYRLHFWDALIVATMEENSVRTILTEDAHFRDIPGITVRDPF